MQANARENARDGLTFAIPLHATVGMSPMAYLRQMWVERMARLLVSTDLSTAEVARAVGWSDPSYATRCFHAVYGFSPTECRRRTPAPLV